MTEPQSVFVDENLLVLWVATIATPSAPTVAELQAGLDLTFYFTEPGWQPAVNEDSAPDPRLAKQENFARPGRRTTNIPLAYISNPANPANDQAALTLLEDTEGFFVERAGVPHDDAIAADQLVTVYPVMLGSQVEGPRTGNTPVTITQMAYLRPPGRQLRVAVAA